MKNVPLLLCLASILLTASGGLNIGLSHAIGDAPRILFVTIGVFFISAGLTGMGASFYALIKNTSTSWQKYNDTAEAH